MNRLRMLVLVLTPLVAIAVLILGLRVGGKDAVRAATVWGTPPPAAGDRVMLQIVTFVDDRGVRESVFVPKVNVSVTEVETGKTTTLTSDTNVDGVLEVAVTLTGKRRELRVLVTTPSESRPLAEGTFTLPEGPFGPADRKALATRATQRTGQLVVDTFVTDQRLVVGYPVPVTVRVMGPNGLPVSDAEITVAAEPGLDVEPFSRTCKSGYSFGSAKALFHTVGMRVTAKSPDGKEGSTFSAFPVAHGAYYVDAARDVPSNMPFAVTVRAPGVRNVAYAEIDDTHGRVFATTLALTQEPAGPSAAFEAPKLPAGLYWIVTSSDPKGAERIEGATVARVLRVGKGESDDYAAPLACDTRADLAMHPGDGFVRTELLDGLPSRRKDDTKREHLGLAIALVGLLAAAIIEIMLALRVVTEARDTIETAVRASEAETEGNAAAATMTKRTSAGSVVVGIAIVVLGFALLAALLVWKA